MKEKKKITAKPLPDPDVLLGEIQKDIRELAERMTSIEKKMLKVSPTQINKKLLDMKLTLNAFESNLLRMLAVTRNSYLTNIWVGFLRMFGYKPKI